MTAARLAPALLLLLTAACATTPAPEEDDGLPGVPVEMSEELVAQLAPGQNIETVRLLPEDGCYWYQWQGPVETTYLPLRTREGRMICVRQPDQPNIGITDTEAAQASAG
jgi:hypothetical protein